jgi:alkylated DNA repair protein (DNA oxidative demethylase)
MVDVSFQLSGFRYIPGGLTHREQVRLLAAIDAVIATSPLYVPTMPKTGRPMSVRMTNCGPLGWVTCRELGYRYQPCHPVTNTPWPEMPTEIKQIWSEFSGVAADAEACLINWYDPSAKLGLHVDRDEQDFAAPVVSVSLGDDAWFRVGGLARRDPTSRILLRSGDVVVMGGSARLIHHGIDRILPNTGQLLPQPGRYNLTLRRVSPV